MAVKEKMPSALDDILNPLASDPLDKPEVVSAAIGITVGTLSVWRATRRYDLPFVKVGNSVRYRRSDWTAWLQRRTANSPQAAD